ncbi:MAG: hypothetical protein ACPIOQ_67440, partial [Promethearchaeia archaeon]
ILKKYDGSDRDIGTDRDFLSGVCGRIPRIMASTRLRVLTLNLCLPPPFLRNRELPSQVRPGVCAPETATRRAANMLRDHGHQACH